MRIAVACPACQHRYDISGKLAGKMVRCKECSHQFRIPVPVTMKLPRVKKSPRPCDAPAAKPFEDLAPVEDVRPVPIASSASGTDTSRTIVRVGIVLVILVLIGVWLAWFVGVGSGR